MFYIAAMADTRSPEQRRRIMQAVASRHTAPELTVRRLLHRLGFRFRLHRKDLPGKPDIVLTKLKTAIFVHGCFWHGHGCRIGRPPKSRPEFWLPKLDRNRARDAENEAALIQRGWRVLTVWQCEIRDAAGLEAKLCQELDGAALKNPIDSTKAER